MAIDVPKSDLARSVQHDPSVAWPEEVQLKLLWRDKDGRPLIRTESISSDQFFGRGAFGAPMDGSFVVMAIERMRKKGPPTVVRKIGSKLR